jgi:hypothetical protein
MGDSGRQRNPLVTYVAEKRSSASAKHGEKEKTGALVEGTFGPARREQHWPHR